MLFSLQSQVPNAPGHRRFGKFIPRTEALHHDLYEGLTAPDEDDFDDEAKFKAAKQVYDRECKRRLDELFGDAHLARTPLDDEAKKAMPKVVAPSAPSAPPEPGKAIEALAKLTTRMDTVQADLAKLMVSHGTDPEVVRAEYTAGLDETKKEVSAIKSQIGELATTVNTLVTKLTGMAETMAEQVGKVDKAIAALKRRGSTSEETPAGGTPAAGGSGPT